MHQTDKPRSILLRRETNETSISLALGLDNGKKSSIQTGIGMLDHLLDLMTLWAGFSLDLQCSGDLQIDGHHTVEDCGMVLGAALLQALGDRKGIHRWGHGRVPMDDALSEVSIDLSGRPWLEWRGDDLLPEIIAHEEKDLWREFFKAFAAAGRFNLHISFLYGKNGHHLLESAAKGTGAALKQAVWREGSSIKSTKGGLD